MIERIRCRPGMALPPAQDGFEGSRPGGLGLPVGRGVHAKLVASDVQDLEEEGATERSGVEILTGHQFLADGNQAERIAARAMPPAMPELFGNIDVEIVPR